VRFMINFVYKDGFTEEAAALLPAESERVRELKEQGVLEAFYWTADRSRGWIVAHSDSREEAEQTLDSMALRRFWDVEIYEL